MLANLLKGITTMNANSKKIVKPDESQNANQTVDKSRRSFAKVGAAVPVIMTLASKSALGESPYHCTQSGIQSGNQSSRIGTGVDCHQGFSPGAWKTPADSGDGSLDQWLKAGCNPFTINLSEPKCVSAIFQGNTATKICDSNKTFGNLTAKSAYYKIKGKGFTTATTFNAIFGGSDNRSLHDILMTEEGSLEFHAIADYLNAAQPKPNNLFGSVYDDITPSYIVNVYNSSSLSTQQKKDYFILIHH